MLEIKCLGRGLNYSTDSDCCL